MSEVIQAYKIQRTYHKTDKYTLTLFIPPAETTILQNGYNVNSLGILYLALPWKEGVTVKRSLEIRVKNQRKILRCLGEALNWLDGISDLFINQDNTLYFNTNYRDLCVKYKSDPTDNPQGMKIVPVVIEHDNNTFDEGVILSINSVDNYIQLTRAELQELFDILYGFNFATEIQVTYQAMILSFMTGRAGTQNQNYANRFLK